MSIKAANDSFKSILTITLKRWSSTAANSPLQSSRSRRKQSNVEVGKVDLVGPPDPISNIRPMFYAPVPSYSTTSASSSQSPGITTSRYAKATPHPYSLSEFSQLSRSNKGLSSSKFGSRVVQNYRNYVDTISSEVEEAEMKLRLSKLTNDTITQRFWRDNNIRFTRDLGHWKEESHRRVAALPEGVTGEDMGREDMHRSSNGDANAGQSSKSTEAAAEMSKDESAFYANWLQANGRRNRAYNVLVWKQAWQQVRLGARVTYLRNKLKALQSVQRG
ncbi:hypothetical protein CBS101457_006009 [Exobasidium rhododendri]|nr:hypothetical protein CBS101457_006009 [Exobasidium rhododendri]